MSDKADPRFDKKMESAATSLGAGVATTRVAVEAVKLFPGTATQVTQFAGIPFVRHVATSTAPAALKLLAAHPIGLAILVGAAIFSVAQASGGDSDGTSADSGN